MKIEKLFWLGAFCFLVGILGSGIVALIFILNLAVKIAGTVFVSLPLNPVFVKTLLFIGAVSFLLPFAAIFAGMVFLIVFVWKKLKA